MIDHQHLVTLPRFTWAEIDKHLTENRPFEAVSPLGSLCIRVMRYEPLVGVVPHSGHLVRDELLSKMAIEEDERRREEETDADRFIAGYPVQVIALDSRFEYDVDRKRSEAVYLKPFQSWGRKVWTHPPTPEELDISLQKYDEFHELLCFVVERIKEKAGSAAVVEIHAYESRRPQITAKASSLPLFDIAVAESDRDRFAACLAAAKAELARAAFPGEALVVAENVLFKKDGALAESLAQTQAFVLPVAVKKIYLDNGAVREGVLTGLTSAFDNLGRALIKALSGTSS